MAHLSGRIRVILVVLVSMALACSQFDRLQAPSLTETPTGDLGTPATAQASEAGTQDVPSPTSATSLSVTAAGGSLITYVPSEGIGDIAVRVTLPNEARYADGAGVVVEVATFLTGSGDFYHSLDVTPLGLIQVTYLWPGTRSDGTGAQSEGTYDYGGEIGIRALRDVIRYATGEIPDRDGNYLADRIAIPLLYDDVGLYAFSHPGLAAVNVIALYGDQIRKVAYFVGNENPTTDAETAVEVGHFDEQKRPVLNPLYDYPDDYSPTGLALEYDSIQWDAAFDEGNFHGRPYFDLNGNGTVEASDYALGARVPTMYDKRIYSIALTQALLDSGALTLEDWPADLARPDEVAEWWSFIGSVERYPDLRTQAPDLKVILVFALRDHVQPARDKPHIHHAFDGFYHAAGLWTRLNPDAAYIAWIEPDVVAKSPEHPANTEPGDWLDIGLWAYAHDSRTLVSMAAVAEMADRQHEDRWDVDLEDVLVDYPAPEPGG